MICLQSWHSFQSLVFQLLPKICKWARCPTSITRGVLVEMRLDVETKTHGSSTSPKPTTSRYPHITFWSVQFMSVGWGQYGGGKGKCMRDSHGDPSRSLQESYPHNNHGCENPYAKGKLFKILHLLFLLEYLMEHSRHSQGTFLLVNWLHDKVGNSWVLPFLPCLFYFLSLGQKRSPDRKQPSAQTLPRIHGSYRWRSSLHGLGDERVKVRASELKHGS